MSIALFTVALAAIVGASVNENARLEVTNPDQLAANFTDGIIPGTPAMFGLFSFGQSLRISGQLYYAKPDDDKLGCKPFSEADLAKWPKDVGNLVVMIDRGNCTFVQKVRDAEKGGAVAAIIVDNIANERLPYMADDNTGSNIAIQSMLISYNDGQLLKDFLAVPENPPVNMRLSWNLPHPDGRVEVDFWTSSHNQDSVTFKKDFSKVAKALGDRMLFTPHFEFIMGVYQSCTGSYQRCGDQCTNMGRYCMFDPERDTHIGYNGSQIVRENLRQVCLLKHLNATNEQLKWWDYVTAFDAKCDVGPETFHEDCSFEVMEKTIDAAAVAAVRACIIDSGDYQDDSDNDNTIIEEEHQLSRDMNIFSYPTLLINNRPYRNSLSCPFDSKNFDRSRCGVLGAICTGYADDSIRPDACQSSNLCPIGVMMDDCNTCGGTCFGCETDACGTCMDPNNTKWNKLCSGCDNVPNSGLSNDLCNVCGGPGPDKCQNCGSPRIEDISECGKEAAKEAAKAAKAAAFPVYGIVLIVLAAVVLVGGGVFYCMRRREDAMRQDIDSLLKQYLPMGEPDAAVNDM